MSDPTPRDTRLFDAGATWATEPTDRRGYGDALRDAVERAAAPGDDRGRELAERDDERRWDIGNALGWELEDESPSWVEIMRGIADLRALAVPAPQITRQADVDPDILAMARRHLAEHDTVDLLARKCLRLIDPMCPSLADKGDSAGMYRDLARRAIRQALASESQAEGAGETAAMSVLRELVEGEDHWTPERDEAFQAAKHRARALVAEGDPHGLDPYGTGDGSYPEPSGGGSS